ncbi:putative LRR receptor-like serine/threonine-protein kinase [Citrus sinensis]|nr:putative LRR receptor-like serine/threonine-protein kinase [Citrus sinensis]
MSSWNDSVHFCNWVGVTCSPSNGRVTFLKLESKQLVGPIPASIGNLTYLTGINLFQNSFHGQIPEEIGRLQQLQDLNLTHNYLSGKIPTNLSHCTELRSFEASANDFIGQIPDQLSSLTKLEIIGLGTSNLTGNIPAWIGNFSSLQVLLLSRNNLHGSIPNELGQLSGLGFFTFYGNFISGIIPSSIYNILSIYYFSVTQNQLHGQLPADVGLTLPNLKIFAGGVNYFTGSIPVSLSIASNLQVLDFAENGLTGSIPENFGSLKDLVRLNFDENELGSREIGDLHFLKFLANCTSLEVLGLAQNGFGGEMPISIANLSAHLRILTMGDNLMHGNIPVGIGNLVNLSLLGLEGNNLSGSVPEVIGRLNKLEGLELNGNKFSGLIPSSLGNLTILIRLLMEENRFEGIIPPSLGNCQKLQLTNLAELDVTYNKLSGEIPSSLDSCISLERLYLGNNSFKGTIPVSLKSLRGLAELDLSCNNLSGKVPGFFGKLLSLRHLNLSYNDLDGEISREGIFANASAVSIVGNDKLCGGIQELHLSECSRKNPRKHLPVGVVIPVTIAVISVIVFLTSLVIYCMVKPSRRQSPPPPHERQSGISYSDISKSTDNFSKENLIGTGSFGSVYKGTLGDRTIVAIKVLKLQQQGAVKSFVDECNALKSTQHRNILRVITACSSVDFEGNKQRDEQMFGGRSLRVGVSRKSQVDSRRPGQRQLARHALQPENLGTKATQPPTTMEMGNPRSRGTSGEEALRGEILEERVRGDGVAPGPDNTRRSQTIGRFGEERGNIPQRGEFHREEEQSPARQIFDEDDGVANAKETVLRQHLHDVEQERDQVAAHDPGRAVQLEEEVRRLAQIIDDMQGRSRAPGWRIMLDGESPLAAEIMRAVISRDFRLPDLRYSGRTDPLVHIERFNDITGVQELSQSQRCRVFPLSLEGRAREWYRKLPRGNIKTFEQMCQEFAEQFSGVMAPEDDMMELKSMKQGEQETLREFIKRFHRAVLDLGAFNHPQALRGLKEGAKRDIKIEEEKAARIKTDQLEGSGRKEKRALPGNGPIRRRDHQTSGSGAGGRVTAYQPQQRPPQYQRSRAQSPRSPAREPWRRHDSAYGGLHQHSHGRRGSRPEVLPTPPTQNGANRERAVHLIDQNQDYGRYTSLKISLDEVYEAIKDRGLLCLPAPITKPSSMRDRGRYCKFHGTHGHTTADCRDLKTQVEDFVRNRYLDEFIDVTFPMVASTNEWEQSDRNLRREQPTVRMIAGGLILAGDSNRSRKNYARYAMTSKEVFFNTPAAKRVRVRQVPIMWTDEDEERILYPHEDALVIEATVASKKFDRILVDTGSSVDVLFKSTLEEIGIADRKLEYTNTSLKGFGGGKLIPLGMVELPITIGSSPTERTMMLDFVVVDEESPYQMILGQPFLRMSKAVLSNHYLALKYQVNGVVGVVRGDQRIARSCYSSAAREAMQITSLDTRVENKKGHIESSKWWDPELTSWFAQTATR